MGDHQPVPVFPDLDLEREDPSQMPDRSRVSRQVSHKDFGGTWPHGPMKKNQVGHRRGSWHIFHGRLREEDGRRGQEGNQYEPT